ncbi:putative hydroxyacylglutathione hydrolase [Trypanosoma theileri]|uniref:hydroxyacylglutathione hydrolase n=1 Tax=Trypanosoma theileri TaxID=67003 RepID=A0A1X0PA00_9TRYP|nr:putative hydroxyacylglutathione hydrolase [Trypanosoma theileri]ORC93746.1 putative hydroxyacylglutathione hydrolase [Trypanosoma theileri]
MKQLIGPCALAVGFSSLCFVGITSVPSVLCATFALYVSGVVPENNYFPDVWFRSNIFSGVYQLYCSHLFGYKYLRPKLHARQPFPHSDYRHGVRCLSGIHKSTSPFPSEFATNSEFYQRGGGLVDLRSLGEEGYDGVTIVPVPIFTDNYAYFILSFSTKRCAVVDPADPVLVLYMLKVIRHLTKLDFILTDILTTHKHWDHAGGNQELLQQAQNRESDDSELMDAALKVYGSDIDKPHACTDYIKGGDVLSVAGGGVAVSVVASPGHTAGSVLFLVGDALKEKDASQRLALFTGDCIFCGGCGAMFEVRSLDEVIQSSELFLGQKLQIHPSNKQLVSSNNVLVYVGHEYTERLLRELINLQKGEEDKGTDGVETGNQKYRKELRIAMGLTRQLRSTFMQDDIMNAVPLESGVESLWSLPACTVPSTLAIERKTNPLLTLKRSAFEQANTDRFSTNKLQGIIYTSNERDIVE